VKVAPHVAIEWVDDEAVALDPESGELHYLNTSAALVLALIEEHGYDRALEELRTRHGMDEGSETELRDLLEEMVGKGLLIE
jgi:hypothetical protein